VSLTLSCRPSTLDRPSTVAERLPKALIHRNVPGERIHALLSRMDACWATAAPFSAYGPRARWTETVRLLAASGWPVLGRPARWRLGELTVPWSSVAPTWRVLRPRVPVLRLRGAVLRPQVPVLRPQVRVLRPQVRVL